MYEYNMDHIFQCVILLFVYHIQASRAGTSVFVKKGSDVQLDVKKADVPEDFSFLVWRVNGTSNLVTFSLGTEPKVSKLYTGRVEFSVTDYTVKLKNVQEADSGDYTARFTGADHEKTAIYSVTVQAPVSPVNLTVDSVSSSSDSCNLTVTCRTLDSHISTTFTCVNQICSDDRSKSTTSGAVLHVYLENDSINCNHSNQVSWTTNQGANLQDFCHQQAKEAWSRVAVFAIVPFVIITGIMVIAAFCYMKNRKKKIFHMENTVYAVPGVPTGQTQQRFSVSDNSNLSPNSTYCVVGSQAGSSRSETSHALPQSVYAEVEGPMAYHP